MYHKANRPDSHSGTSSPPDFSIVVGSDSLSRLELGCECAAVGQVQGGRWATHHRHNERHVGSNTCDPPPPLAFPRGTHLVLLVHHQHSNKALIMFYVLRALVVVNAVIPSSLLFACSLWSSRD